MQEKLLEIAIKRSFLIPSFEIYGHISGFYDFGWVGAALKRKIQNAWRDFFVKRDGIYEIETSTLLPEIVLQASGHASSFGDPLVTCTKCKHEHRADHVIFAQTKVKCDGLKPAELNELIKKHKVTCPDCKAPLPDVGWFNLMFKTNIGPVEGHPGYTRPETAQGIFLDFLRVFRATGTKLPLAIAQIGRSYRNEISPRQGLIRLREFTQMEIEHFFEPASPTHEKFGEIANQKIKILDGEKEIEATAKEFASKGIIPNELMAYYMAKQVQFYLSLGIPYNKMRLRKMPKEETPHYSKGNFDMEVETSYGWVETIGTAYRTDYDLSSHAKMSKQELSVFIEGRGKVLPHVVEPSFGVDRLFWCILEHCFRPATKEKEWEWFDFPAKIAPFHCAVLPLMKKDGLAEKAEEAAAALRSEGFGALYDESGSIGRRYARQDEIGTPYCITIDYDSLKNGDATVRFRNDGKQIRVKLSELADKLRSFLKEGKVTA